MSRHTVFALQLAAGELEATFLPDLGMVGASPDERVAQRNRAPNGRSR
jgi:hypothetical protein